MPTTTTYGYIKPNNGERGFWANLNANTDRLNNHTHDGVDSAKIPPTSITKATQSILSASWSSTGGGNYTQTVTLPTGYTFSNGLSVKFYTTVGGTIKDELHASIVWISNSQYQLQVNDNTLALTAVYA